MMTINLIERLCECEYNLQRIQEIHVKDSLLLFPSIIKSMNFFLCNLNCVDLWLGQRRNLFYCSNDAAVATVAVSIFERLLILWYIYRLNITYSI